MTTCPSGRDDWPWLMPALEEDDMALTTADKIWLDAKFKMLKDFVQRAHEVTRASGKSAGGGLTASEIKKAVKDALKEGTG